MEKIKSLLRSRTDIVIAVLGGLIGMCVIAYMTKWGPWAYTDSVSYVEAARNLGSGGPFAEIRATGVVIPFDKQPPLYPWLLAIGFKIGLSIVNTARWIDIFAFGILVFTAGISASRFTSRPWLSPLVMLAILTSPLLLDISSGVMTEALFLMLSLAGLSSLAGSLSAKKYSRLPWSALLVAMSALTRYAGTAVIATGLASIILLNGSNGRLRRKQALVFGLITLLPIAFWVINRLLLASQLSAPQPPDGNMWQLLQILRVDGTQIIWSWLPLLGAFEQVAYRLKLIILILSGLVLLGINLGFFYQARKDHIPRAQRIAASIFLFHALIHILFMIGVTVIGPWEVRIDARQMAPIFLFGILGLLFSLDLGTQTRARQWVSLGLQSIIVASLIVQSLPQAEILIKEQHNQGRGYTARVWHDFELLQTLEDLPEGLVIISNDIEGLMFHVGISAYRFTEIQEGIHAPIEEPYGTQLGDPLQAIYAQDCAAIVLVNGQNRLFKNLYGPQAQARIESMVADSYLYFQSENGSIYFFDDEPAWIFSHAGHENFDCAEAR